MISEWKADHADRDGQWSTAAILGHASARIFSGRLAGCRITHCLEAEGRSTRVTVRLADLDQAVSLLPIAPSRATDGRIRDYQRNCRLVISLPLGALLGAVVQYFADLNNLWVPENLLPVTTSVVLAIVVETLATRDRFNR